MSASAVSAKFVASLGALSKSPHPYAAIAREIESMALPAATPLWAHVLSVGSLIASFALLSGALLTCIVRVRAGNFYLGHIAKGHILRPNAAIAWSLGCVMYSLLEIIDLSLTFAGEYRHTTLPGNVVIPGTKYIPMWTGAWCFSWSSFGHYVCSRWDRPWQLGSLGHGAPSRIPRGVAWALNVTFAFVPLIVGATTVTIFSILESREFQMRRMVSSATNALRVLDASRPPDEFNLALVFRILQPLAGVQTLLEETIILLRAGLSVWISYLIIAIIAQSTFIICTLKQTRVGGQAAVGFQEIWDTLKGFMNSKYRKNNSVAINSAHEATVLVILSASFLLSGLLLAPVPIWELSIANLKEIDMLVNSVVVGLPVSCVALLLANFFTWNTLAQVRRLEAGQHNKTSRPTDSDGLRLRKSVRRLTVNVKEVHHDTSQGLTPSSEGSHFLTEEKSTTKMRNDKLSARVLVQSESSLEIPGSEA